MKRLIYISILLISILTGCSKAPVNSDVEGFWKLRMITVLSTDETKECTDIYYSITHMITEVRFDKEEYISLTEYCDNETKLVLKDFKVRIYGTTGDNGQNAPVEKLNKLGINSQQETVFDILHCNGKTMTLQSDYARLELEKF